MAEVGTAELHLDIKPDELVRVLRVIAKHATACADELSGADVPAPVDSETPDIEAIKRERAERHARLGGNTTP